MNTDLAVFWGWHLIFAAIQRHGQSVKHCLDQLRTAHCDVTGHTVHLGGHLLVTFDSHGLT